MGQVQKELYGLSYRGDRLDRALGQPSRPRGRGGRRRKPAPSPSPPPPSLARTLDFIPCEGRSWKCLKQGSKSF